MKTLLSGVIAAALLASPVMAHGDDDDVKRDVKQTHDLKDFDKIEVVGVYKLDIRSGDKFSVRTEARKKDAKWMKVRQEGDTLVLGAEDDEGHKTRGRHNKGILAIVTMPRLSSLEVAGIATGEVSAFTGGDVDVDIAGISDLALSGTCDRLDIQLAGMGDLDAHDLKCADVNAELGGMGSMDVYASERIDATVGGMGSIDVHGGPTDVSTDKSMFSSIKIR
ncbi:hypothetical protein GCM10007853_27450 [Algimonas ampicilliniresistens]|uniref:Putative auto-transporter adhesin head GIN domain-containing protein n=1 Tax=Algimonas ampicilliniresistens TaxID=1298735 RepID=A0ABQ5VBI7_9PROT|nr:head GIN domain-containing protein [Algimonas ampicilliniresistens]GLQ24871.1 hypothetical protein GCM10007853_27450 [Algimonas ampicilliniresistens]